GYIEDISRTADITETFFLSSLSSLKRPDHFPRPGLFRYAAKRLESVCAALTATLLNAICPLMMDVPV
ncbi:hypothetical protein, partial [Bifidobacterium sp.]